MNRKLALLALSVGVLTTLTACDPPIPQSLLVAQAELEVQCGEPGEVSIYMDSGYADLSYTWQEMLATSCPDLVFTPVEDSSEADLVVSGLRPSCEAVANAPLGYDSAAVIFYLDEAFSLNLTGEVIAGIFSGEITNWNDPIIAEQNPEVDLPDLEIAVVPTSATAVINSMQNWTEEMSGAATEFVLLADDPEALFADVAAELEAGSIGLIPLSDALIAGATIANIVNQEGEVILPDQQSLYSGSTMFGFESFDQSVIALFDENKAPHASPGSSTVAKPYKAMFPIDVYLCGEDSLTLRAAARFLVRLDAQGVIATSSIFALDEDVRVAAAAVLGSGLPVPEFTPSE